MQPLKNSKIISALICITLLFSLSACASDNDTENEIPSVYEPEVLANSEESNETGTADLQNINEEYVDYDDRYIVTFHVDWQNREREVIEFVKEAIAISAQGPLGARMNVRVTWHENDTQVQFATLNVQDAEFLREFWADDDRTLEFRKPEGTVILTGLDIKSVEMDSFGLGQYGVAMNFTADGAIRFHEATIELSQRIDGSNYVDIFFSDEGIQRLTVMTPIPGDSAMFTAHSEREAAFFITIITVGMYPTFTLIED